MKTYVLTISEFFPKTHNKSTLPTGFIKSISNKSKKHTIRGNYELWKKRFEKINDGKAVLSVRYWSGKPYKSKQIESFVFGKDDGIGIERLILNPNCVVEGDMPYIESTGYHSSIKEKLAKNDGLSFEDFTKWFEKYDLSKAMAIIHFTDFRYCHYITNLVDGGVCGSINPTN